MLTDKKQTGVPSRTPFTMAQGASSPTRPRVQTVKPVQTGNIGLTRPVMSNQDAAASGAASGVAPNTAALHAQMLQQSYPISQNLPSQTQPRTSPIQPAPAGMVPQSLQGGVSPAATTPMRNMWEEGTRGRDLFRMSSSKEMGYEGPQPYTGVSPNAMENWWELPPGESLNQSDNQNQSPNAISTDPESFLGSWAPNASYDPSMVVRSAIQNMKNSDIMQLLLDISNGRIKGRSDE